jgi:hexokinase
MSDFLREVKRLMEAPMGTQSLLNISAQLQDQFEEKLRESNMCMLPSYNHTLPTGSERGTFLALDVGGSTFRIALVNLNGPDAVGEKMEIAKIKSFKIDNIVKRLRGTQFFDWMAEKIDEMLADPEVRLEKESATLSMGLAWSFPIEYALCDFT